MNQMRKSINSHRLNIDYGYRDLVVFNELTKYYSFIGAGSIDHQRRLFRSLWLQSV